MAGQRQVIILLSSMLLQLVAISAIVQGASFSSNPRGAASNDTRANASDPIQAAPSDNQFEGVSVSAQSGADQPTSGPNYNLPPPPSYAAPTSAYSPPVSTYSPPVSTYSPPVTTPFLDPAPPASFGGFGFPGIGGNVGLALSAGGYFPIIEKAIVVIGFGLLLLVILAILKVKLGLLGGVAGLGGLGGSIADAGGVNVSAGARIHDSDSERLSSTVSSSINKKF